jgi:hypothetical protein
MRSLGLKTVKILSEWTGEISIVLTYQKRSDVGKEPLDMILMITKILDCFGCFVTTLSQSILLLIYPELNSSLNTFCFRG